MPTRFHFIGSSILFVGVLAAAALPLSANELEQLPLSHLTPSDSQATLSELESGEKQISIVAGATGYPGVRVRPPDEKPFDLSPFSRVEAVVRNTGEKSLPVTMRVDNVGHWKTEPYSVESIRLRPGETGTIVVFFGYRYGFQEGFALNPSEIP